MRGRIDTGTALTIAATVTIWSTTFAALVAALGHFSPGRMLFLRWTLTALSFVAVGVVTRIRLPRLRDLPRIAAAGLLGFGLYQLALGFGQAGVSASMAGFLINMVPVFTMLISVSLGRERSTAFTWAGLAISLVGILVLAVGQHGGLGTIGPSAFLVVLGALSFASYTIVSKPLLATYRPMEVTTYALVVGVVPFFIFAPGALAELSTASGADIATLLYLAVMPGGIAFFLWARVVSRLDPGVAAPFLYLVPVVGVPVAWIWVGEVPTALTIAGGLVTVAGVAIAGIRTAPRLKPVPHLGLSKSVEPAADAA